MAAIHGNVATAAGFEIVTIGALNHIAAVITPGGISNDADFVLKIEYIAGETVYTLVLKDALPETCLRQVQAMCRLLYPAHTNIDYFPTNFILQGDTLYYIDYECNDYMDEWNFENWGCKYWAKTPEFLQYAAEHP